MKNNIIDITGFGVFIANYFNRVVEIKIMLLQKRNVLVNITKSAEIFLSFFAKVISFRHSIYESD